MELGSRAHRGLWWGTLRLDPTPLPWACLILPPPSTHLSRRKLLIHPLVQILMPSIENSLPPWTILKVGDGVTGGALAWGWASSVGHIS